MRQLYSPPALQLPGEIGDTDRRLYAMCLSTIAQVIINRWHLIPEVDYRATLDPQSLQQIRL